MCCSFCGKTRSQVSKLIQGPGGVYICDECVHACADMIGEAEGDANAHDLDYEDKEDSPIKNLPTPHEIYQELSQYVHGSGVRQASDERRGLQPLSTNPEWERRGRRE